MTKRKTITLCAAVAALVILSTILAIVLPLTSGNGYNMSAPLSAFDCEQTVYVYDDDYDLVDTLHSSDTVHGFELKSIGEENSLTYVNHVKNKFVGLYGVKRELIEFGEPERLDRLSAAEYGTLQFVFFNLDPVSDSFEKDRDEVISRFAYNNGSTVNIDLLLPACFDAATVYCGGQYVCAMGDMGSYDPTEYIDKYVSASFVPNVVELSPQHIDVTFSVGQNTISPDRLDAAKIVTVHYRAKRGADFSSTLPAVGKREKLKSSAAAASSLHIALLAVAAAVFVAFTALVLLKRAKGSVNIIIALGGTIALIVGELAAIVGGAATGNALSAAAVTVILCAPLFSSPLKNGIMQKLRYSAFGLGIVISAIGCVLPFAATAAAAKAFLRVSSIVVTLIAAALAAAEYAVSKNGNRKLDTAVLSALCGITAIAKAWSVISPTAAHPSALTAFFIAALALWLMGYEFFRTEKRDAVLRSNLQKEVDIQTATLKNAIADREKLLSFVSHDMRKSALGIGSLVSDLKSRGVDDGIVNIANKIENKNDIMLKAMTEILGYAKNNYSDEPFERVSVTELFEELKVRVQDDCEANGITLAATAKNVKCRAQKNTLLSVLFNLVFNAIEHADCTKISVTAAARGDKIIITITDNGKGVEQGENIFSPFSTGDENAQTNSGLGLFIVKSQTENMGGSISYSADGGGSSFTVALLREL